MSNRAFEQLKYIVRRALDHYATERSKRRLQELELVREVRRPSKSVALALDVLEAYRSEIPAAAYRAVHRSVSDAVTQVRRQADLQQDVIGQLAAFASAGSLTLVYDHEVSKQIAGMERAASKLRRVEVSARASKQLNEIADDLEQWAARATGIRSLVSHLADPESRDASGRYKLVAVLDDALRGARYLTRGVPVKLSDLPRTVRLHRGSYAGWVALFQNLLVNAANAVIARGRPGRIEVSYLIDAGRRTVRLQDTGTGIDLNEAESYFEPFQRHLKVPSPRQAIAAGGTGLGLTIVRLIANEAQAEVRFVKPDPGFATCVELRWEEVT